MKNIFTFLFTLLTIVCFAQVPQGVSYQAVAFNSGGTPVANGTVGVKVSVLDNSATGTVVYSETHTKTTNAQGLFNLNIGQGTPISGTFSGIDWGTNSKFLKVEVDPTGGTSYTNVGVNQLMSVPYALFAEETANSSNNTLGTSQFKDSRFALIDDNKIYVFENGTWYLQNTTSFPSSSDVIGSNGNFVLIDDNKIYAFENGTWYLQNTTSFPSSSDVIGSNGNFVLIDDNKIYAFENGTWHLQNTTSFPSSSDVKGSNGKFVLIDDNKIYAFENGIWYLQNTTSFPSSGNVISSNGKFVLMDDNKIYVFENGSWHLQNTTSFPTSSDIIISNID
ncbi:MAG: YXWGXW repeat-containing protein [Chitinophagales bacterium]|nr:YXWGXW repeat-containing protein [Chitinophagales bacterium]